MCSSSPQPAGWAADRHGAAAPHSTAPGWALLLGTLRSAQPRSPEAHLRSDRSDKGIKAILIQQSANNNAASIYILCHDFHPKLLQHSLHSTNASPVRMLFQRPRVRARRSFPAAPSFQRLQAPSQLPRRGAADTAVLRRTKAGNDFSMF